MFGKPRAVHASVEDREIRCLVCGGDRFLQRTVKLNTSGMEFLDLGWANQSSLGLICISCGYLHEFVGDYVTLREA